MNHGLLGGILGGVLGLLGGVFGTWCSIRNTNGPRERAFMVRAAAVCWIGVLAFLAALWLVPSPWKHLLWIPYAILLPLGILKCNRTQARIREEEAAKPETLVTER